MEIESHDLQHQLSQHSKLKRAIVMTHIAEPLEQFIIDLVSTWKLLSPTIIFQEEIPSFCWRLDWILCVTYDRKTEHLAEHMARISKGRKQDGTIFVGSKAHEQLLTQIVELAPSFFTSECPVFMPKDTHNILKLRLDSNIIFYEEVNQTEYKLVDIFAVKGGLPITLDLGKWDIENGVRFQISMNRWKRRTDLKGAIFVNGIYSKDIWALPVRDQKGNIIGSQGFMQDKLFYVIDGLNLKIKTVEYENKRKLLENGTWEGPFGMIQRKEIDADSVGVGMNIERLAIIDFPMQTHQIPFVLIARVPEGTALNMWAYISVFGVPQWSIFLATLTLLAIGLSVINSISKDETITSFGVKRGAKSKYILSSLLSNISLVYLYTLQMGSHTSSQQAATRIITITMSFLTLLIFVYYTTEITAEMTSGPPEMSLRNFDDVIQKGYTVVTASAYYNKIFAQADPGSAKYRIYKRDLEPVKYLINEDVFKKITTEEKVLLFTSESTINYKAAEPYRKELVVLKIHDGKSNGGLALTKDSEFLALFNYYILKAFETGVMAKLHQDHHSALFTNQHFGMPEPQPLTTKNAMFLFILIGFGVCISIMVALMENMHKKCFKKNNASSAWSVTRRPERFLTIKTVHSASQPHLRKPENQSRPRHETKETTPKSEAQE